MKMLARWMLVLGAIGLAVATVFQALAWRGVVPSLGIGYFPLGVGVLVLFVVGLVMTVEISRQRPKDDPGSPLDVVFAASGAPSWATIVLIVLAIYAIPVFLLYTRRQGHGFAMTPSQMLGASAMAMLFCYYSLLVAWSAIRVPELLGSATGRDASSGDRPSS